MTFIKNSKFTLLGMAFGFLLSMFVSGSINPIDADTVGSAMIPMIIFGLIGRLIGYFVGRSKKV